MLEGETCEGNILQPCCRRRRKESNRVVDVPARRLQAAEMAIVSWKDDASIGTESSNDRSRQLRLGRRVGRTRVFRVHFNLLLGVAERRCDRRT